MIRPEASDQSLCWIARSQDPRPQGKTLGPFPPALATRASRAGRLPQHPTMRLFNLQDPFHFHTYPSATTSAFPWETDCDCREKIKSNSLRHRQDIYSNDWTKKQRHCLHKSKKEMGSCQCKATFNNLQSNMTPSQPCILRAGRSEHPTPEEAEENKLRNSFMKIIETLKWEQKFP